MHVAPGRDLARSSEETSRPEKRPSALRYVVSLGSVAMATALKSLPLPIGRERPFLLLFGAVVFAAWYGGRGAAVAALALATAAADLFFLPPYGQLSLTRDAALQLGVFVIEAGSLSVLAVAVTEARADAMACAIRSRRAEEELRKQNRAYRALSMCNQILVRAQREEGLLEEICRAIVEVAGYRMCWVGYAEHDDARTVRPIAKAGYEEGYLETANITWADCERGRGPTGTALRTAQPYVHQDVIACPAFAPWRAEALKRGYSSVIALPLRANGQVFGAITIYASEREAFDKDAVRLLIEMASDIGYGVTALRGRRALEEARAVAEQARRAQEEFLRIAAHELRTPLTPILGWAQILERAATHDSERLARGLEIILRSARREARLVDDLIDVAQMVAGEWSTEVRPIELGPIVADCVDEARASAAAKGVEITASIPLDTALVGDARRLRQVACNLISNAIKFTPRGGRVSVEVARERESLILTVRDTGKGISAGEMPHVFQPFRTGDPSMTRAEGGLGLGLSIVRYIVEAHGGTVRAESAGPGRGTTVIVELRAPARHRADANDLALYASPAVREA